MKTNYDRDMEVIGKELTVYGGDAASGSLKRVVSVRYGELKLCGCENHPHRTDLSCCKIRQTDGKALTEKQVWEVMNELAGTPHANNG